MFDVSDLFTAKVIILNRMNECFLLFIKSF